MRMIRCLKKNNLCRSLTNQSYWVIVPRGILSLLSKHFFFFFYLHENRYIYPQTPYISLHSNTLISNDFLSISLLLGFSLLGGAYKETLSHLSLFLLRSFRFIRWCIQRESSLSLTQCQVLNASETYHLAQIPTPSY